MIKNTEEYLDIVRDFFVAHRDMEVERARRSLREAEARGDLVQRQLYRNRLEGLQGIRFEWETQRDAA